MKKYRFALERVLALRRMEAGLARARLEAQMAEVRQQDEFRREIARQAKESAEAARRTGVTGIELIGASNFRDYARRADDLVAGHQKLSMEEAGRRRQAVVEAERNVKVLENLEQRQRLNWQREAAQEVERFAAEAYLGRWRPRRAPVREAPD